MPKQYNKKRVYRNRQAEIKPTVIINKNMKKPQLQKELHENKKEGRDFQRKQAIKHRKDIELLNRVKVKKSK